MHNWGVKNVINTKRLTKARGKMSRSAVAAELGVSRQQIWNYENGVSEPPLSVLFELARIYKTDPQDFIVQKNFARASSLT